MLLHSSMEGVTKAQFFNNGGSYFTWTEATRYHIRSPGVQTTSLKINDYSNYSLQIKLLQPAITCRDEVKVCAIRRRRIHEKSDTYVLLEPGEEEKFVSSDELRDRLRSWLENWPGKTLPPDLARYETIDDAVSFLLSSVCELKIDGDVGSVQWYEVRLE